jgi:hypothetical protein
MSVSTWGFSEHLTVLPEDHGDTIALALTKGETMTEQDQQLNRVAATAKDAILTFINARLASDDPTFTADQLRNYVMNNVVGGVSPGSSDRVLRMLRQTGKINYVVMNRGKSLYKAVPLLQYEVPKFPVPTGIGE